MNPTFLARVEGLELLLLATGSCIMISVLMASLIDLVASKGLVVLGWRYSVFRAGVGIYIALLLTKGAYL